MRLPSSLVAPALAVLSALLLCGPVASQTTAGSNLPLPDITVEAPKPAARPHHEPGRTANNNVSHRRTRGVRTTTQTADRTPVAAPGSVMARLKELERTSSNCTDGCQTSFKYGNQPWNGCSGSEANFKFSSTCRNVRNFKTYQECRETGMFLGARHYEVWWYCSSLLASGKLSGEKFQVAEIKQAGRR